MIPVPVVINRIATTSTEEVVYTCPPSVVAKVEVIYAFGLLRMTIGGYVIMISYGIRIPFNLGALTVVDFGKRNKRLIGTDNPNYMTVASTNPSVAPVIVPRHYYLTTGQVIAIRGYTGSESPYSILITEQPI